MGRPIGSVNREKPFNDALRIALKRDPRRLLTIAEKLAEKAEGGDLAAIREIADRLDGKPGQGQVLERHMERLEDLTNEELLLIASRGRSRSDEPEVLLIPPGPKSNIK